MAEEINVDFQGGDKGPRKNIYRDRIWVTKTGDLVPLEEMGDEHLKNLYNLMLNKSNLFGRWTFWLPILKEEMLRRKNEPKNARPKRRIRLEETE